MWKYFVSTVIILNLDAFSQITLESDFSTTSNRGESMQFHWDVFNRISPGGEISIGGNQKVRICVVRPLGGKAANGRKLIEEDTYKWDGQKYYYDWKPLKDQINSIIANEQLFTFLIDNLPWAFQRGIDRQGRPEIETYGNAWGPNDPEAWATYIKAMLNEMIKTYGRQQVAQWRYCIGREVGTPGHWQEGQAAFFEHYRNTEKAVRAVIPEAKVGTHFLWASSNYSYGPDFVKWSKANKSPYDFIGVSFYPFYDKIGRVDLDEVYRKDFAPIKDQPDWNPAATLELHEYALISSLNVQGNGFTRPTAQYTESFNVMLTKMMYENGMQDVYQWGSTTTSPALQAFREMTGHTYYKNSKRGAPQSQGNMINAIFSRDEGKKKFNIVAYSYNADPGAKISETVNIVARVPSLPNTDISYRIAEYRNSDRRAQWSDWKKSRTLPDANSKYSVFTHSANLEPFSFYKLEIIADSEIPGVGVSLLPQNGGKRLFVKSNKMGINQLEYRSPASGNGVLEIHDVLGHRVYSRSVEIIPGTNKFNLPSSSLPSGHYLISLD